MTATFSAYPNPFTSNIKLVVNSTSAKNAIVNLLNMAGQRVVNQLLQLQSGQNVVVLENLGNMQPGIYIVELVSEDGKNYQKVVKQ
jgi:hypothetical protein